MKRPNRRLRRDHQSQFPLAPQRPPSPPQVVVGHSLTSLGNPNSNLPDDYKYYGYQHQHYHFLQQQQQPQHQQWDNLYEWNHSRRSTKPSTLGGAGHGHGQFIQLPIWEGHFAEPMPPMPIPKPQPITHVQHCCSSNQRNHRKHHWDNPQNAQEAKVLAKVKAKTQSVADKVKKAEAKLLERSNCQPSVVVRKSRACIVRRAGHSFHPRFERGRFPNFSNFTKGTKSKHTLSVNPIKKKQQKPYIPKQYQVQDQVSSSSPPVVEIHKRIAVAKSQQKNTTESRQLYHRIGPTKCTTITTICLKFCQFKIIRRVAEDIGFKLVDDREEWNIMWSDTPMTVERLNELRRMQVRCRDARVIFESQPSTSHAGASVSAPVLPAVQKLNHFPGMNEICRKDRLARNLKRMKKYFPKDYDFFPETWTLPTDLGKLMYHSKRRRNCTFICKPDTGSQGRGIFLVRDLRKLNPFGKLVCQLYIPRPLLVDGYKFDLRLYVLITSCDPLRVYLYNEGIARFATVKYAPPSESNLEVTYMHLTNYSLNKFSQSYVPDASKRKLSLILDWMQKEGYDIDELQSDIDSLVVKTVISAHQPLKHYYRSFFPRLDQGSLCFEVLGFDVLIDERMKPFLLEVNHSPSYGVDLPIDEEIKFALLKDTLGKIYLGENVPDKRALQKGKSSTHQGSRLDSPSYMLKMQGSNGSLLTPSLQKQFRHESTHGMNYRLIYPLQENYESYEQFMSQATAMDLQSTDGEKGSEN